MVNFNEATGKLIEIINNTRGGGIGTENISRKRERPNAEQIEVPDEKLKLPRCFYGG